MASIQSLQDQLDRLQELGVDGSEIPGTAADLLLSQAVPVTWMPGSVFKYEITPNGDLEFECLDGDWRMIRGANSVNADDAKRWLTQIGVLVEEFSKQYDSPVEMDDLYNTSERFRSLSDNLMRVMGFKPEWWKPSQLKWLLFQRVEEIEENLYLIAPPVPQLLRSSREPWMPPSRKTSREITRRAELIAMLAGACGGDLDRANALAESNIPYRELIDQLDAWQYFSLGQEKRKEIEVEKWRAQERGKSIRPPKRPARGAAIPTSPQPTELDSNGLPPSPVLPKPRPRVHFADGPQNPPQNPPKKPTAKRRPRKPKA